MSTSGVRAIPFSFSHRTEDQHRQLSSELIGKYPTSRRRIWATFRSDPSPTRILSSGGLAFPAQKVAFTKGGYLTSRSFSATIIRAYSCLFALLGNPEMVGVDFLPPKSYFRRGLVPSVLNATCSLTNYISRIYHMNISDKGNVCIDILKNNWSPALSIFKVVLSLSSLLTDPNPCLSLLPLMSLLISLISLF